ncbi:MAG TPA: M23 family metallopeptidase [Vicinamibacteria bacterium]|nr:M23 family metallopeptidase [Vicinamibacteria bacterium]
MLVSRAGISRILGAFLLTTSYARAFEEEKLASVSCGESVVLRISDGAPKQGSIGIVELRSEAPLVSVNGFLGSEPLSFWHDDDARVFQALFGVDLQKSPGTAALRAKAVPESGPALECSVELRIADGAFPVQRLEVAPKYVELSSEDLARSKRESAELAEVFSSRTNERLWRGPFRAPVSDYHPSGSFGKRRVFNDQPRSPHSGEDFSAPAGTPVRATARGRVVLSKGLFFLGNTVILDHGLGLFSFYGHLSSIAVEPGTLVESDSTIGQVGATGRVTGAHLHWGVRLGDARVDPMDLIALGR